MDHEVFLRLRKRVRSKSTKAYEELVAIINRGNFAPKNTIRGLFQEVDDPAIVPIITFQLFYHGQGEGAKDLIDKLGTFDTKDVQEPLIKLFKNPTISVRLSALQSLGLLSDPLIYEVIVDALEDPAGEVREEAYNILAYAYVPEAVQFLIEALQDTRYFIIFKRPLAAQLLSVFPDNRAIKPLIAALDDEQQETRISAIKSLAIYQTPEVESALEKKLASPDTIEALEAAKSLRDFDNAAALSFLIEALATTESDNHIDAISILGTFNDKRTIQPLTKQLFHQSVEVRDATREALSTKQEQHDLTPLLELLDMWDSEEKTPHVQYLTSLFLEGDQHLATTLAGIFYGKNPHWNGFLRELSQLVDRNEWRHLPFFSRIKLENTRLGPFQIMRLTTLLKNHARKLKKERDGLLCSEHLTRFSRVQGLTLSYYACRICRNLNSMIQARHVIAVLDKEMKPLTASYGDTYLVNWLKRRDIFDFDVVEIGACSEEDITSFCIDVGNDTDPYRSRKHKHIVCHVQRGRDLPQSALRRLQVSFSKVRFISVPHVPGS